MARGKLHVEMMPEDFPGECPAGAAVLVSKVRSALNVRFQGTTPPRVLFVDRGKGLYTVATASITSQRMRSGSRQTTSVHAGRDEARRAKAW